MGTNPPSPTAVPKSANAPTDIDSARNATCHARRTAFLIALGYALVGAIWIATSDRILAALVTDHETLTRVQMYKGWSYIGVTAILLGWLVGALLCRLERIQQTVRESEERFHTVASATTDAIWDWNLLTDDLWWNEGIHTLFGYSPRETAGGINWWYDHIHPDDRDRVVKGIHDVIDAGKFDWSDEYRYRKADGAYADVYDRGCVIHDARRKPVRMVGGMTDITQRKRADLALRERLDVERLLLQELDHRVRNNLTALLSLVDMTRRSVGDVGSFADRISGRVRALANVHGLLSDSRWGSLSLRGLITAVAPAECIKRVSVDGDDEQIPSRQVTGLAMVLHELMTNRLKYGALSAPAGRLDVSWTAQPTGRGRPRTLTMRWREIGGPFVDGSPAPSVGMELVEGLTKTELRGEAVLRFPRGGADHTLTIGLDESDFDGVPGERARTITTARRESASAVAPNAS